MSSAYDSAALTLTSWVLVPDAAYARGAVVPFHCGNPIRATDDQRVNETTRYVSQVAEVSETDATCTDFFVMAVASSVFRSEIGYETEVVATSEFSHKQLSSCLLYTSPSPRDATLSRMPSSA